jgi:hypothetical protein
VYVTVDEVMFVMLVETTNVEVDTTSDGYVKVLVVNVKFVKVDLNDSVVSFTITCSDVIVSVIVVRDVTFTSVVTADEFVADALGNVASSVFVVSDVNWPYD